MVSPKQMVTTLRGHGLRCRTGVLALGKEDLGRESEIAAALDVELVDYRTCLLARAPEGSKFLNLSLSSVLEGLDAIANATTGESCVLVADFDIAVAKLGTEDRLVLWRNLFTHFPYRTRALVLCVPAHREGRFSFPDVEVRQMWQESNRYATWQ